MNYEVSIPTKLLFEEELSSTELRLYLIIRAYVNEFGYTRAKNTTLAKYLDISERHIKRLIEHLKELNLLVVENDVKKGKVYPENYRRVIWLKEAYDSAFNIREYRERAKTKENDYKKFVEFLRHDEQNRELIIKHSDGRFGIYANFLNQLHFKKDHEWFKLTPKVSKEIYKIFFKARELFFRDRQHIFSEVLSEEDEVIITELNALSRKRERQNAKDAKDKPLPSSDGKI